ncbi:MAG TPA: hypothetical protein VM841_12315 [Actinomycetota bacterium]|nr:hypothetical protein [Actinomycetota bacterium]
MIKKLALAAVAASIALSGAQGAFAHRDTTPDTGNRCDTWSRPGHGTGDSHHHTGSADINGGVVFVHQHGGHYVVRNDNAYVEVVGGQGYRGPSPTGQMNPGQGGYVQGEADLGIAGVPDADFHANVFSPDADHPPALTPQAVQTWANGYNYLACLNVANSRIETKK